LGIIFLMVAGGFYFAAWMIANDKLASNNFSDIFKVLFAIMFAAMAAGQSGAMAPDYAEGKNAANRIFKLLEREVRNYVYFDAVFRMYIFCTTELFTKLLGIILKLAGPLLL